MLVSVLVLSPAEVLFPLHRSPAWTTRTLRFMMSQEADRAHLWPRSQLLSVLQAPRPDGAPLSTLFHTAAAGRVFPV